MRRSPSLKDIVDALEHSDVIVYVRLWPRLPPTAAGHFELVSANPGARYLRISVRAGYANDTTISLLAHELQHALEVARAADVRTPETFNRLFQRIGTYHASVDFYDTLSAQATGTRVREELRSNLAGRTALRRSAGADRTKAECAGC